MFPCSLLVAANRMIESLADENIGLLHQFVAKNKVACRIFGGSDELMSELFESYKKGVSRYVFRKWKHRKLKISTFICNSLEWGLMRVYRQKRRVISVPFDSMNAKAKEARRLIFFHGSESRCNDESLLVREDVGQVIDLLALEVDMGALLKSVGGNKEKATRMYYGIGAMEESNFAKVGEVMGLSRERVRQLIEGAKRKLSSYARGACLDKYRHLIEA